MPTSFLYSVLMTVHPHQLLCEDFPMVLRNGITHSASLHILSSNDYRVEIPTRTGLPSSHALSEQEARAQDKFKVAEKQYLQIIGLLKHPLC